MTKIQRLVLDVLKPHRPTITDMAKQLSVLKNVTGVNLTLYEVDQETENIKITIEGNDLDYEKIEGTIEELGAVIHSVDEVAAGSKLVEEVETPQDK
ncbi:MAG: DUF211 domain-containing protein [Methanosarcinales archaeon]|nr:MAG: DUF211 domain-containing protein [Methanosarcinales archaeon]